MSKKRSAIKKSTQLQPIEHAMGSSPARKPLVGHQENTRSLLLHVNHIVNPLVASASALFHLMLQIQTHADSSNIDAILDSAIHEIKAFENKAHKANYRAPLILASRYLLCALIDEAVLASNVLGEDDFQAKNLLNYFYGEAVGSSRVFVLLERAYEDPTLYIDFLELSYLCLSHGLKGHYAFDPHGESQLISVMDHLYYLIIHERGELSRQLALPAAELPTSRKWRRFLPSSWMVIVVSIIILFGVVTIEHHRVENKVITLINIGDHNEVY